jgi:hypothetical protein
LLQKLRLFERIILEFTVLNRTSARAATLHVVILAPAPSQDRRPRQLEKRLTGRIPGAIASRPSAPRDNGSNENLAAHYGSHSNHVDQSEV